MVRNTIEIMGGGTTANYALCSRAKETNFLDGDNVYTCKVTGEYCTDPHYDRKSGQKDCSTLKKDIASKVKAD